MNIAAITQEWYDAGGTFHGPIVETATMPLGKYIEFRRKIAIADWIESKSSLHSRVEILYVVDGYEVSVENDRNPSMNIICHGETVAEAFAKIMEKCP